MNPAMDRATMLEAVDLGYVEMYREMVRRGAPGIVIDKDGMMLVAGADVMVRVAMRTDPRLSGQEFLERIETFFREHKMDHHIITRMPQDEDIVELLAEAGMEPDDAEPVLWLDRAPAKAKTPSHAVIKEVRDDVGVAGFAAAVSDAFGEPGIAGSVITGTRSLVAPHLRAFVGSLEGEPVATALVVEHAGTAGIFWVGTVDRARHHGFGEAMVRTAAVAGFEMGARFVWAVGTRFGLPVYHKVGFTAADVEYLDYRFPAPTH
jgi:hypothetical protein